MKIRHALGAPGRQDRDGVPHLWTTCGIWVDAERCDEALRATCELCKARILRARERAPEWVKVTP